MKQVTADDVFSWVNGSDLCTMDAEAIATKVNDLLLDQRTKISELRGKPTEKVMRFIDIANQVNASCVAIANGKPRDDAHDAILAEKARQRDEMTGVEIDEAYWHVAG